MKIYETNNLIIKDLDGNIKNKFDENGFSGIRWRDEYPSSDWVFLTGSNAPDILTVTINGLAFRVWSFDGANTQEVMGNNFEIPHDIALDEINDGTEFIEVHIHFMSSSTNTGNVKWFFDYLYIPVNSAPLEKIILSCVHPINNEQYVHKICSLRDDEGVIKLPKPSTGFNIGDVIMFNVRRSPIDVEDTLNSDVYFIQCALHVPTNDNGSRQRYIK